MAILQNVGRACRDGDLNAAETTTRVESLIMVLSSELRTVHDLLYRPQETPDEQTLEYILVTLASALDEARENLDDWNPSAPSSKAIGAAELIAHLQGSMTLEAARDSANIATRQYAKRQRTWFRSRMKSWNSGPLS